MDFKSFFEKCQNEATVGDFESYVAHCIFEKNRDKTDCTIEEYTRIRDLAFERRDERAARAIFELAGASEWQEDDWEGAFK